MKGFLKKLGMENMLDGIKLNYKGDNLEDIYSELHEKPQYNDIVHKIETAIYNYFSDMELPFDMTIYDYLVISLTNKDCIASFNWDPLLLQAYNRMRKITANLPELIFQFSIRKVKASFRVIRRTTSFSIHYRLHLFMLKKPFINLLSHPTVGSKRDGGRIEKKKEHKR